MNEGTLTNAKVMTRARQSAAASTGNQFQLFSVPLADNTFTQAADEFDQFALEATITAPASCQLAGQAQGVTVLLFAQTTPSSSDDHQVFAGVVPPFSGTQTVRFETTPAMSPGAEKARALEMFVGDNCDTAADFTISNAKIDVTGMR